MTRLGSGVLSVLALGATGCYTTHNVATLSPLDTAYPVSASSQYVDRSGAVVDDEGYTVERPFEFEKTVSAPRHESTETALELRPELDRLLASSHGDAITNLKVQAVRYEAGSHVSAANWKILGWTCGLSGGALLAAGAATDRDTIRSPLLTTGAVFAGVGVLSFVFAAVATEPTSWHFKVSGLVVKSTTRAAEAPLVAPAAPSPPVAAELPSPPPGSVPAVAPAVTPVPPSKGTF